MSCIYADLCHWISQVLYLIDYIIEKNSKTKTMQIKCNSELF